MRMSTRSRAGRRAAAGRGRGRGRGGGSRASSADEGARDKSMAMEPEDGEHYSEADLSAVEAAAAASVAALTVRPDSRACPRLTNVTPRQRRTTLAVSDRPIRRAVRLERRQRRRLQRGVRQRRPSTSTRLQRAHAGKARGTTREISGRDHQMQEVARARRLHLLCRRLL